MRYNLRARHEEEGFHERNRRTEGASAAPDAAAPAAAPAPGSTASPGLASRGQAQAAWAQAGWNPQNDDPATAGDPDDATNVGAKIVNGLEPVNDSGFTPPVPDGGVKAINTLELIQKKLGLGFGLPLTRYTKWVDDGILMRGSEQDAKGFAALKAQGVKTVVNLRLEDDSEKSVVQGLGMQSVWLPAYDQGVPSRAEVSAFLKVVNDPTNQPVYVHCQQGVGRTGIMSACFRIAHDGYTPDQAIAEARQMGMKSSDQGAVHPAVRVGLVRGTVHRAVIAPVI